MPNDTNILRALAGKYAEAAQSSENLARPDFYRQLNSLKQVRPPVLVFEEPWGEFSDCDELRLLCEDKQNRALECTLRRELYKWQHFRGDYALHPYFPVQVALRNSGIGVDADENVVESDTGSSIMAHHYNDMLPEEEDIDKLVLPEIELDKEATDKALAYHESVFDGLMPVRKQGVTLYFASWDVIPRLHGVDNCLCDLYDRPEYVHKLMEKFTLIHEHELTRYEQLNVLETDPYYTHCTPACTYDLPPKDMDKDKITAKDVWCRAMAQIFAVVSPEMHEEFDLQYTKRLFDRCGLSYYGCCEPLDTKIDNLRQFKNLRRVSITPWANPDVAADKIGRDYVFSCKPNPANVAARVFDPEPVKAEIKRVIEACKRNGTAFEFILKDISTVSKNPQNISDWVRTVNETIDECL